MRYQAVIFDFDGTLCDTGKGIMKSAKYALDAFGYETPEDYRELSFFIGPPLLITFQEKLGADPAEAEKLVKIFRKRYTKIGLYESRLCENIKELLVSLKKDGLKLGIASSKPRNYIEALLEHFGIEKYFDSIAGVTFASDCESKSNIISRCLNQLDVKSRDALMIGDKKYDIEGAKNNIMDSCGILWGYGTKDELTAAGAVFLAEKPFDIEAIALGYFEQTLERSNLYSGRIITVHNDKVMLADKIEAWREVVDHPGGVAVVGVTEDNKILLVRQFRYPYHEVIYEIPAGKLEKGEDPLKAGIREFREECGASADEFSSLGEIYPTPGYCGEIIRIYAAFGLTFGEQHLDNDEFLDVYQIPLEQCVEKIMNGEIKDAKTIVGIMKLKELKKL